MPTASATVSTDPNKKFLIAHPFLSCARLTERIFVIEVLSDPCTLRTSQHTYGLWMIGRCQYYEESVKWQYHSEVNHFRMANTGSIMAPHLFTNALFQN